MLLPHLTHCLSTWFNFPTNKIYCQVATLNGEQPRVRTMDFYEVTAEGNVVLLTETSTRKWNELSNCSNAAICILNKDYGQILAEGEARLKTSLIDLPTTEFYWNNCLDQYWRDFYLSQNKNSVGGIPLSFGIIIFQPISWEILEIDQKDFLKSSRKHYYKQGSNWIVRNEEIL